MKFFNDDSAFMLWFNSWADKEVYLHSNELDFAEIALIYNHIASQQGLSCSTQLLIGLCRRKRQQLFDQAFTKRSLRSVNSSLPLVEVEIDCEFMMHGICVDFEGGLYDYMEDNVVPF